MKNVFHATAEEWKRESSDDIHHLTEVMKATNQKVAKNGKSRYIPADFNRVE